jgi:hypothetical protein
MVERFVERVTHVYDWQLARRIGSSPEKAELKTVNDG